MSENPTKFEDIDADVLRRQAVEDWAVEVKPSDSLKKVIKALEDGGVYWEDYAEKYGYNAPQVNTLDEPDTIENVAAPVAAAPSVYDPSAANTGTLAAEHDTSNRITEPNRPIAQPAPVAPRVQQPIVADGEVPYLVKMERPNVRYVVRGYVFTKEHPYALVAPKDFEYVVRHEPGFRQAYPSELAEFYG